MVRCQRSGKLQGQVTSFLLDGLLDEEAQTGRSRCRRTQLGGLGSPSGIREP